MEKKVDNSKRRHAIAGLLSMLLGGALLVTSIPGQAGAQPGGPPGNNGTIKLDREAFDDHPDNEPHVGCIFQLDFYGFDEGDLNAHVSFEVQPPTGKAAELLWTTCPSVRTTTAAAGPKPGSMRPRPTT